MINDSLPDCCHTAGVATEFSPESIVAQLREKGLRITPGRRLILDVLFSAEAPLSILGIQQACAELGVAPDYATVFRMLDLMESLGLVQKVNLRRSCSYFELRNPSRHYDHIVCTSCGRVILISDGCPLTSVEHSLAEKYGFSNVTHSLEFFGTCKACQGAG